MSLPPIHREPGDFGPSPLTEDPQAPMFRGAWSVRNRRQRGASWFLAGWFVLAIVAVTIAVSGAVSIPPRLHLAVFPLFFLPVLFHSLFTMVNCRCPRCNRNLSRLRNPRFCFNCGLRLRD